MPVSRRTSHLFPPLSAEYVDPGRSPFDRRRIDGGFSANHPPFGRPSPEKYIKYPSKIRIANVHTVLFSLGLAVRIIALQGNYVTEIHRGNDRLGPFNPCRRSQRCTPLPISHISWRHSIPYMIEKYHRHLDVKFRKSLALPGNSPISTTPVVARVRRGHTSVSSENERGMPMAFSRHHQPGMHPWRTPSVID